MSRFTKCLALVGIGCLSVAAFGQSAPVGTTLLSQIDLATFGAASGNDCWGYVSPSGREYALMGCNNQVVVVEITDPSNPVIIESIPHSSSSWGDIKTYQGYAYVVTETAGTGVQVIDLNNVDNGVVTLVRTLASPGRSHNVVVDTTNGFLYTVGSRNGTGTTMCFSLADPSNPVQVGPNSMTANYHHDAQVVTYTEGPYAGKQIWFGFSEGRGVDIYDMTDKNNPTFLSRATYPNIGYCHQGWLSADKRFLYVDDELDESQNGGVTRSLVFDVTDLSNPVFLNTFSSGLEAIDHNQYVVDGFSFQANYRSGLRIFDTAMNPTAPVEIGSYDTYPANDNRGFSGAWSNYPFFPSGNVIVSDINRGLFVLDVTEATTRTYLPRWVAPYGGEFGAGSLSSLFAPDGDELFMSYSPNTFLRSGLGFMFTGQVYDDSPLKVMVEVKTAATGLRLVQVVEVYNFAAGRFETIHAANLDGNGLDLKIPLTGNLQDYIWPNRKEIRYRVRYLSGSATREVGIRIDVARSRVTR